MTKEQAFQRLKELGQQARSAPDAGSFGKIGDGTLIRFFVQNWPEILQLLMVIFAEDAPQS